MKLILRFTLISILSTFMLPVAHCQTSQIPNADFENWVQHSGYSDPQYWDTPNLELMSIPIFGQTVVSKSTSHASGSFSAKLETKTISIPGSPVNVPGVITLGKLTIDMLSGTYSISGGAPIHDQPTHLKGFYRFSPVGGDSCVVGIALFKTIAGNQDTIALGYFSSKVSAPDWTPFSAWIEYLEQTDPDTLNILAISTAQFLNMHNGTVLYLDNLSLDYTLGIGEDKIPADITVYQDKETRRLLVFTSSGISGPASLMLVNLMGQKVFSLNTASFGQEKTVISYDKLKPGVYILQVLQGHKNYCHKFFLNP